MQPVAIIFGLACGGAIAFSAKGDRVRHLMAWMMLSIWAAANLLWLNHAIPALPLFDLPMAMWAYAMLCVDPRDWRFCLCVAFAFRMVLHIPGSWGMIPVGLYSHWINAAFLAALVAISWEGESVLQLIPLIAFGAFVSFAVLWRGRKRHE